MRTCADWTVGRRPDTARPIPSEEIAWLRRRAVTAGARCDELVPLVAAEPLQSHDKTGCSLDQWVPCREFVELLWGHEIPENLA